MKKLSYVVLVVCLVVSLTVCPAYASQTVVVSECGVTLSLPDTCVWVTTSSSADDLNWESMGFDYDETLAQMKEDGEYLIAADSEEMMFFELIVNNTGGVLNWRDIDEETLIYYVSSSAGVDEAQVSVYDTTTDRYVVVNQGDAMAFLTSMEGITYCFRGTPLATVDLVAAAEYVEAILESVTYEEGALSVDYTNLSESFVYTNEVTGVSVTVPEGWYQSESATETNGAITTYFYSEISSGEYFSYCYMDIWAAASVSEKIGMNDRSDMNNDFLSDADVKDMAEVVGQEDVERVYYSGREYFHLNMNVEAEGITLPIDYYMFIENGYMNQFYFFKDGVDVGSILESVSVGTATAEEEETVDVSQTLDDVDWKITNENDDVLYDSEEDGKLSELPEKYEEEYAKKAIGQAALKGVLSAALVCGISGAIRALIKPKKKSKKENTAARTSQYFVPDSNNKRDLK